ncbi:MAG: ketoacyl-ACP synthase III [Candidatus Abyssobacteria bacterium SURF_5]|uniref:Beta-ketoacyl-[acyl-carrier-protein] synthase III n=1 Tax=Abyssobacteria bacterium (strain SURF_5) TaxID=2093360 RepID=A0A3A4NSX2_ABYX5|nr:MAG: ketoacyl-ACP synthase III [Candidatus Abyssubacteria bacterium SURF_5]
MPRAAIRGLGQYLPERVVRNDDLAKMFETSDEWIRQRTGITERRYVEDGTGPADLAVKATADAVKAAGIQLTDIEFIIFATLNPDYFFPGSACILQEKLGLAGIGALDIRNQCSGFIYSLSVADAFIRMGMYRRILVVGAEVHSSGLEFSDRGRDVTVLFGDGAGALILEATEEDCGILSTHLHADGRFAQDLWIEAPAACMMPRVTPEMLQEGRHYPRMNGKKVFKMAVEKLPEVINEGLRANGLTIDDVSLFIPHQANLRINELVARHLKLPPERMYNNIQRYGNTTAASIPIALNEALQEGKAKKGDVVLLAAFGSGFTWGSCLLRL